MDSGVVIEPRAATEPRPATTSHVAAAPKPAPKRKQVRRIQRKVALITGATGRIAEFIGLGLAKAGYKVVLVARDAVRVKALVVKLKRKAQTKYVTYRICDVSSYASISKMAAAWKGPLHVLINNAAVTPLTRHETAEGIELQWATNVMGYYWMMTCFGRVLKATSRSRVVNMTSGYAGGLKLDDVQFIKRAYRNDNAYKASKMACRILTGAFARKEDWSGIRVNSCHPGVCTSKTSLGLGFDIDRSDGGAAGCAETPLYLATDKSVTSSGGYYSTYRRVSCNWSKSVEKGNLLLEVCANLTPKPKSS